MLEGYLPIGSGMFHGPGTIVAYRFTVPDERKVFNLLTKAILKPGAFMHIPVSDLPSHLKDGLRIGDPEFFKAESEYEPPKGFEAKEYVRIAHYSEESVAMAVRRRAIEQPMMRGDNRAGWYLIGPVFGGQLERGVDDPTKHISMKGLEAEVVETLFRQDLTGLPDHTSGALYQAALIYISSRATAQRFCDRVLARAEKIEPPPVPTKPDEGPEDKPDGSDDGCKILPFP
ncbi:hypothetical protein ACFL0V_01900 [Nanoarchaeota archaeon]